MTQSDQAPATGRKAVLPSALSRTMRGALWLGSGQMFGDLCAIGYFLILARTLGSSTFNDLVLVMAVGQSVAHVFGLQSWRTIVRFGHAAQAVPGGLFVLCRWVATRDIAVGLAGAVLAAVAVWTQGALLGIPPALQPVAACFCLTLLFMQRGIPSGILRLRQRFALCAAADAVLPVCRILLAILLCVQGCGVVPALLGLALSELIATVVIWCIALSTSAQPGLDDTPLPSAAELSRFYWRSGCAEALRLAAPDLPVLGIALGGGGAALGAYRLAIAIAKATSKPTLSVSIAFYSEASRQRASGLRRVDPALIRQTLRASLGVALLSTGLCYVLTPLSGSGPAMTAGLWLSMIVASLAAFLESRLLVKTAPLVAVLARLASIVAAFFVAWAFGGSGGREAGLAAAATGGFLHFLILTAWLLARRASPRTIRSPAIPPYREMARRPTPAVQPAGAISLLSVPG